MFIPRVDLKDKAFVPVAQAMYGLEKTVRASGLESSLLGLVKVRASQINGCGYCIDMHTKDARAEGETEQRLYCLSVWHESPLYSDRERAALEWTEHLTRISESYISDELFQRVSQHFSKEELGALTLGIIAINGWNRLCIPFRAVPGTYQRQPAPELARQAAS
jgi:AhpD family alkylhydroperoxidase